MRRRKRVDWDEELRKTEQIRRKGLFTSALTFGAAAVFIVGAGWMNPSGLVISRKVVAAFCLLTAMFLFRGVFARRARLRREREQKESPIEWDSQGPEALGPPEGFFRTHSEEETLRLGEALGRALVPGLTVLLSGGLGAGKTVLVRGVGEALGVSRVRSPSFTLVNEYRTVSPPLVHADLYRLEPDAAGGLGLEEYVCEEDALIVEWPERWRTPPENDVLKIAIETASETERLFVVNARGKKAEAALRAWLRAGGSVFPAGGERA
jgi:tRNA threonylcarbamoyladenosine biosynthesis protein TsaE